MFKFIASSIYRNCRIILRSIVNKSLQWWFVIWFWWIESIRLQFVIQLRRSELIQSGFRIYSSTRFIEFRQVKAKHTKLKYMQRCLFSILSSSFKSTLPYLFHRRLLLNEAGRLLNLACHAYCIPIRRKYVLTRTSAFRVLFLVFSFINTDKYIMCVGEAWKRKNKFFKDSNKLTTYRYNLFVVA